MRVIAGRFGGRPLDAPRGSATRPTSDRVREALFSMLGDLENLRVADLYAGTGALGIEALSRGALWVTFVESNRAALAALRRNIATLGLERQSRIYPVPVERALKGLAEHAPYQLLLCDPPWADLDRAFRTLEKLIGGLELLPGCRIVVEHAARDPGPKPTAKNLELLARRAWGDTAVSVFVVLSNVE